MKRVTFKVSQGDKEVGFTEMLFKNGVPLESAHPNFLFSNVFGYEFKPGDSMTLTVKHVEDTP